METPLSNGLNGLAGLVEKKWIAAMGMIGMLLFVTTLVIVLPGDTYRTQCIALIMFGWGFGQTEARTFREIVGGNYKITAPLWRLTPTSTALFAIAAGATFALVWDTMA